MIKPLFGYSAETQEEGALWAPLPACLWFSERFRIGWSRPGCGLAAGEYQRTDRIERSATLFRYGVAAGDMRSGETSMP